jgi:dipeptidase
MCLAIIAGKKATVKGSIILAHNEQNYGRHPVIYNYYQGNKYCEKYKIREESFNFLHAEVPKLHYSDNCINDNGVVIVGNGCPSILEDSENGIGYALPQIIAKYAKSARDAIDLIDQIMKVYGYKSSGRTFSIADRDQAYVVSLLSGNDWLAYRVPDEAVVVIPNTFVLGNLENEDMEIEYFGSENIMEKMKTGTYSFKNEYSKEEEHENLRKQTGRDSRQHYLQGLILESKLLYCEDLKFALRPAKKLDEFDLMSLLRSHHETEDVHQDESEIEDSYFRSSCNIATQEGAVFCLDKDILVYRALSVPCLSPFIPYHYKDNMPNLLQADIDHFNPNNHIYEAGLYWHFYNAVHKVAKDKILAEEYRKRIANFEALQSQDMKKSDDTKKFSHEQLEKAVKLAIEFGETND